VEKGTPSEKESQDLTLLPRPCRLRSVDLGITGLASQFIPSEALANDLRQGHIKASTIIKALAIVETEGLLIEVAKEMKRLDADIGSFDATLQKAPIIFESVGVDVLYGIGPGMVNDVVNVLSVQSGIGYPSVSENLRASRNVFQNFATKGLTSHIGNHRSTNLSTPFQDSKDCNLIPTASAHNFCTPLADMHVAGEPADKGFVNLDLSAQFSSVLILQGEPDAVQHEPRGFLSDAKIAGDFIGTDSVLTVRNHPHCHKPLIEANRRIFKDSPDLNRELAVMMDALALPLPLISKEASTGATASRADHFTMPSSGNQVTKAVVGLGEIDDCFLECFWLLFVSHENKLTPINLICQVYSCPN